MSEVYVYLVDQMHISINEMFKGPEKLIKSPMAEKRSDLVSLKKYADLAEQDRHVEIGTFYHSERVSTYEDNLQVWFDYACFCKRVNQFNKADECFKETLSRDSKHIPT
jgi:Ni2+-binding GTPase involved in maturation of urease and hydrogenase